MADRPKTVLAKHLGKEDAEAFDAFVGASPYAGIQQTRAWALRAPRSRRQDYLYFLCREGAAVIGAGVVRRSRLAPGASLATLQRGPAIADPAKFETVLAALGDALRRQGFCSLVLAPRVTGKAGEGFAQELADGGFRALSAAAQALHTTTGIVPLHGTEDELLARFKQRGRRAIRKAQTAGVTVRDAVPADLSACQALLTDFHAKRPGYEAAGQLSVEAQAALVEALGGALLVAECGGGIVGFHSFVRQGDAAYWLSLATDDDPRVPRSYLLLWEAMRRARGLGLQRYDLAGLAEEGTETGRDQFKQAFAPEREQLLPAHVAALRPLRHLLFFSARQAYRVWRRRG